MFYVIGHATDTLESDFRINTPIHNVMVENLNRDANWEVDIY